jgi:hypothetical protein
MSAIIIEAFCLSFHSRLDICREQGPDSISNLLSKREEKKRQTISWGCEIVSHPTILTFSIGNWLKWAEEVNRTNPPIQIWIFWLTCQCGEFKKLHRPPELFPLG